MSTNEKNDLNISRESNTSREVSILNTETIKNETDRSINILDKKEIQHMKISQNIESKIEKIKKFKIPNIPKIPKKIKKIIIINLATLIYNLLAFYFYYLSLEGCFLPQSECIPLLSTVFLAKLLLFGVIHSLMIAIEIYLIIYKFTYVYHLIYISIFYYIIYNYDHGTKLDYHGLYNFALVMCLIIAFSLIIGLICLIIFIKRKKNKIYWGIFIIISLYFIIRTFIFFHSFKNTCKRWDKGLNSTVLDNSPSKYDCVVMYPKKCLIYNLNNYFDISVYLHKKCSVKANLEKEHNTFMKYLKVDNDLMSQSNLTHFGLPITVNNPIMNKSNLTEYFDVHNFVYKNTILMDLYNSNKTKYYGNSTLKPEIEIFYDKKTKHRSAKMHLIKNETLSKVRNEIANDVNNKNTSLFNNILLLYIDCVSRQHFLRKMKKTASFIEKFMGYNNNLGFTSYQFMKYHTFAHYTNPNIAPMFFSSINKNGRHVNLVKYLKENGFVTGNSGNFCSKEPFELDAEYYESVKLILDEYDHENIGMFCDPNYSSSDSPYPIFSGPYGILRKCLYGLDTFKYLIEFGRQFWNLYPNNKKYLRLAFQDGHEPTGQVIKYVDEHLYNFLNQLYKNKLLNDTAIFILSDHGNSYFNYVYYYIFKSDDSLIERTYGTLFIILPNNNKDKIGDEYYNAIHGNQQTLISPFDIHDTLIHIIFGNNTLYNKEVYSHHGNSLLSKFDVKSRKCDNWKGYLIEEECYCKQ